VHHRKHKGPVKLELNLVPASIGEQ
jgi:hypothetical protein